MSSFINNDNRKIIKVLNKLVIIYGKSLKRKKLIYFLQFYNNTIKLTYSDFPENYNNSYCNNKKFISNINYSRNNTKFINSSYQISKSSTAFCKDLNFILNQQHSRNTITNKTKKLAKFISLKKRIPNPKIINTNKYKKIPKNKNNAVIKYNNSFNSNLNNCLKNCGKQEDKNENLIKMFTKNIQISKLAETANKQNKNYSTNKRNFSSENFSKIAPKSEKFKYHSLKYPKHKSKYYTLNFAHIPSNSQSNNDFRKIPKYITTNTSHYYNFTNHQNNLNDNDLYSFSEQFNYSSNKNNYSNYKKINHRNYTNNLNVLLKSEMSVSNNSDLNKYKNHSVASSPFYLNKSSNFYFINNELNLTNNEDEINEKILQYINRNKEIKKELISKINKSKINQPLQKVNNFNEGISNHTFKNINQNTNSLNNTNEEVNNPKSYRINTEFEMKRKKLENKSLDIIISHCNKNKNKNNVIYRNKNNKIKNSLHTINGNRKMNFNSCNDLSEDNQKIYKNTKNNKVYNDLNKNKCDNIIFEKKKIQKQPNIISNEINEEFNLKNEKLHPFDEDEIFRVTMQSLNDSKMLEMASKYVDNNKLVDKKEINEILNEKSNQQLFKKLK